MDYKIVVSPRAQREIENAIDYYSLYSVDAPETFINLLENSYNSLAANPFFRICYKNIRAIKIKKFPYSIYFVIHETNKTVRILSCFHHKRNPDKRPKV